MFVLSVWQLWLSRNERGFKASSSSVPQLIHKTTHLAIKFFYTAYPLKHTQNIYIYIYILQKNLWATFLRAFYHFKHRWSSFGSPGRAGGEEVFCDFNGFWLKGFSIHLGTITNNIAEIRSCSLWFKFGLESRD